MPRRVRGALFVDYVRMIRGRKDIDWSTRLAPEDLEWLEATIDPEGWYPMETFERFGLGIVEVVAGGQLGAVQMWGQLQVDGVVKAFPNLVARGDPRETLMRFHALHRGFFDYDAVVVDEALDDSARIAIHYGMSPAAEQAACHQTLGFFERLVARAGGTNVTGTLTRPGWSDGSRTTLELHWSPS